jgi:monofunctional biosynthetic peptidoglycan transglycosylase
MLQQRISNLFSENNASIQYEWIADYKISNSAKLAVIAAEDQKFFDHYGFDIESITKAIEQNQKKKRIRGASTITQQTAKNLFLWPGKSFIRKGLEAYFTVLLEVFWSKERILEVYLNIAEFGENVYGVQAASNKYFNKDANKLSYHNSASLASVLPNPKRFKVNSPTQYLARRIQWIERQMYQLGEKTIIDN